MVLRRIAGHKDLTELREKLQSASREARLTISVCGDTGCTVCGSAGLAEAFRETLERRNLARDVELKVTGCLGFCEQAPVVLVFPGPIFYQKVLPADVNEIVERTVEHNEVVERLLYTHPQTGEKIAQASEIPFYKNQSRALLEANWHTDPLDISDYIAQGGYRALSKVLAGMTPEAVIAEVRQAGLRGRGGAGFPTALKWEACRRAGGEEKYVICNADEGDPGAFMDRSLLEGNPHAVLEGMLIAGFCIGARTGIIYVRAEYPTAVIKVEKAVQQARDLGLIGRDILGSGFDFEVGVSKGAGAFVCGEETALVRAAEGLVGEPRQKPPYPAEQGYRGKPTLVNNVETFANVPPIINEGPGAYRRLGTESSGGTKIFCLVGKVRNSGLVEVPFGTTLRQIIFEIGGGIKGGKRFKAVQTGGPSGGCLPEDMLDTPVDFEELARAGSIMGSGGMIVMDEDTCVVDLARYFLNFLKNESCGKCFSCRVGISRMLEILERITQGDGAMEDLALLEELATLVKDASLCGLGQTAGNPVLSTLRYFREEYLAHVQQRQCPAGVCRSLFAYRVDDLKCTGCDACTANCPVAAIEGEPGEPHRIDAGRCTRCGTCVEACAFEAITKG
jgi:NADH:ubiquinone oxidoreductase subunit F (NADH-binding)/(2Fe-2S) ferredoxin/NAD-dependent dihydropyrimidine dehydrogenase PreA subunit